MKRILFLLGITIFVASCDSNTGNTMTVSGNIKGLKKGTLFLQHFQDSALVALDSLEIEGDGNFAFSEEVESPEVFYLYLKKQDNNDINDRIIFFGESGEITINTSWNTFDIDPEIYGSESHEKFEEFNAMISNFNIKELELIQQAQSTENPEESISLDSLQKTIDRNIISRYRYILNFGLNNGDSHVTPYVLLTQANDANPKYLDSIYGTLSTEVAASKYGKALKNYLGK
ncbi:DUF4369 domain-containing protein [Flagellimonas sp. S3867]|uniref:DUF4369 domain-containing protein n=1 Tax=Flagellimonas sp. S3867 TaxID=2768063 RepID=UPI0016838A53|nr:DUF4369 domain-containing protein [Flagellimonas sp. S3867]